MGRDRVAKRLTSVFALGILSMSLGLTVSGQAIPSQDQAGVITVEATGTGSSDTEALKDAIRNAVRQACGFFLRSETVVEKDELVRDKVLSISEGVVTSYEEIESKRREGLVIKRIRARVEPGRLARALLLTDPAPKGINGKKLFAKLVSQIERDDDARDLLESLLSTYPEDVVSAQILGEPEMRNREGSRVTLEYRLALGIDQARYESFVERVLATANRAGRKGTVHLRSVPDRLAGSSFFRGFTESGASIQTPPLGSKIRRFTSRARLDPWLTGDLNPKTHFILLVNTSNNDSSGDMVWQWFHLPLAKLPGIYADFRTRFSDDLGRDIVKDTVRLGPLLPAYNFWSRPLSARASAGEVIQIALSPFLMNGVYYSKQIVLARSITVDLGEIRKISGTFFELALDDRKPRPVQAASSAETAIVGTKRDTARVSARESGRTGSVDYWDADNPDNPFAAYAAYKLRPSGR